MSMARRTGTGDPPSVTLSTSIDFLSGLRFPWRLSMGESTRFLGGSAEGQGSEEDRTESEQVFNTFRSGAAVFSPEAHQSNP